MRTSRERNPDTCGEKRPATREIEKKTGVAFNREDGEDGQGGVYIEIGGRRGRNRAIEGEKTQKPSR